MKTVAHLIHSFDQIGGAENGIINVINNLQPQVRHLVCSLTTIGQITERIENRHAEFIALNKKEGNDLQLPYKMFRVFRREKVDVVHLRGWATLLEGYLAGRIAGVERIVYSEHGRHFEDIWQNKRLNIRIKKYIFSRVDRLMSVSAQLKNEMSELYGLNRDIAVIHNGVDTEKFSSSSSHTMCQVAGVTAPGPVIGIVGRLAAGKGISEFIDHFARRQFQATLIIVGDGPLRTDIQQQIKQLSLDSRIKLLGNRNDVDRLLNCFDVLAMPSQSEGLSNVILEAMATGIPVVAFAVGGNAELVDNHKGGCLVPLGEWVHFCQCLQSILDDQQLRDAYGQHNRSQVIARHSLQSMAEQYSRLYFE